MDVAIVDLDLSIACNPKSAILPNEEEGNFSERSFTGAVNAASGKVQKASTYHSLRGKQKKEDREGGSDSSGAMEERSQKGPKASTYSSS